MKVSLLVEDGLGIEGHERGDGPIVKIFHVDVIGLGVRMDSEEFRSHLTFIARKSGLTWLLRGH